MSRNLQDRVGLGPSLAAFLAAFLAVFLFVLKDADDFGLMSWNLQNRVVSKTLLSFFLSWRHVPCVTERKSARSDFSDCSPGEISRLPEIYFFLTSLSLTSQRNLSPETSSWILRKRLLGLKPCSWAQCRQSLGFLDFRFYMSRLRSLVTRLPYKKNKRDANTSFWLRYYTGLFLFLSFLFFLVWFPFCNREISTRDIQSNFSGKEVKFCLISYSRMKQGNFEGIFPKRRLRAWQLDNSGLFLITLLSRPILRRITNTH